MKTVVEMALEAGLIDFRDPLSAEYVQAVIEDLTAFSEFVRAAEREALVESIDWTALMRQGGLVTWGDAEELGDRAVAAIRARGENT